MGYVEIICIQFWGHSQMHSTFKILIFSPLLANGMRSALEETTRAIAEEQWRKVSLLLNWHSHTQKYWGGRCRSSIHAGTVSRDAEGQLPIDLRIYWNSRKPSSPSWQSLAGVTVGLLLICWKVSGALGIVIWFELTLLGRRVKASGKGARSSADTRTPDSVLLYFSSFSLILQK